MTQQYPGSPAWLHRSSAWEDKVSLGRLREVRQAGQRKVAD